MFSIKNGDKDFQFYFFCAAVGIRIWLTKIAQRLIILGTEDMRNEAHRNQCEVYLKIQFNGNKHHSQLSIFVGEPYV